MSVGALPDEIRSSRPDGLLIWSGAGISAELPTGGPRGVELTDRALRHGFQEETGALLACYYAALDLAREQPRLETVLDVVNRVHGTPDRDRRAT
jgi:hypothetical protein